MSITQGSRRALLAPLALCIIALGLSLPTSAFATTSARGSVAFRSGTVDASAEQDFLNRTNSLRSSLGLPALRSNSELLAKARSWSQTQATSGSIFHSTLTSGVTQNWHRLGENVGMGPDVGSIHNALVASPRHYENLSDSGFTEVGIGVVRQGNVIYVTQVFMELMPSSTTTQTATTSPGATSSRNASAAANSSSSSRAADVPVAEAAPLKTASPDLNATIRKISILET
jgi:hypothetical protein